MGSLKDIEERFIKLDPVGDSYPLNEVYEIPFNNTPSLRIQRNIEIIKGRKRKGGRATSKRNFIERIIVRATQTRDERVAQKVYYIDVFSESFGGKFLEDCWKVEPCQLHRGGTVFTAYPKKNAGILRIDATTSVKVCAEFI